MFGLAKNEARAPEAMKSTATLRDSRVKVGKYFKRFVMGLPRALVRHDAKWVIVDRLTKSAHFLPIRQITLWKSWLNYIFKR